jgi:uncharacterized protein (TIGR03067 family)
MTSHLLIGLALAFAAPAGKDAPKKDPPSLVGEWLAESGVKGGKPDNPPPGTTMTFTADGKVFIKDNKKDSMEFATYKADPKKNPAEIELVPPPAVKDVSMLGIYKIDGDTLTICIDMGGDRPKEFASPAGSKHMLITCKRAKKE